MRLLYLELGESKTHEDQYEPLVQSTRLQRYCNQLIGTKIDVQAKLVPLRFTQSVNFIYSKLNYVGSFAPRTFSPSVVKFYNFKFVHLRRFLLKCELDDYGSCIAVYLSVMLSKLIHLDTIHNTLLNYKFVFSTHT